MNASVPRWRPMRTAPKDGSYILIAYPSFSGDDNTVFVGHGRWTEEHPASYVDTLIRKRATSLAAVPEMPFSPPEPHWEVAYVSVRQHGGRFYHGLSYEAASTEVRDPIGWMPVPEPPKARKRRKKRLTELVESGTFTPSSAPTPRTDLERP